MLGKARGGRGVLELMVAGRADAGSVAATGGAAPPGTASAGPTGASTAGAAGATLLLDAAGSGSWTGRLSVVSPCSVVGCAGSFPTHQDANAKSSVASATKTAHCW